MVHEIQFPRNIDNLLVSASDNDLMVIAGWHMLIPREIALGYVAKYNTDPNAGFFDHDGKVMLSHGAGKLSLSEQEATEIVGLIKAAYAA